MRRAAISAPSPRRVQSRHTFIASVPREGALRTPDAPGLDGDDNWADED
ncbi:hypothetical protein [Streptomyces sp. NPDC002205]